MSTTKKNATKAKEARNQARKELADLPAQLAEVATLKGQALVERYTAVVGKEPKSKNQHFLRKRIAIELQRGPLPPEKKARIKEVQEYALKKGLWPDIRNGESREAKPAAEPAPQANVTVKLDPRLPPVGTVIAKEHGNEKHLITVLADGFEYRGEKFRSLSAIARKVTGTTWNGFLWAGLTTRGGKEAK